jgi:hypothetical protein
MDLKINSIKPTHYVSLVGGIGNQLFQYAQARATFPEDKLGLIFGFDNSNSKLNINQDLTSFSLQNFELITPLSKLNRLRALFHNLILRTSSSSEKKIVFALIGKLVQNFAKIFLWSLYFGQIKIVCQSSIGFKDTSRSKKHNKTIQIGYFQHSQWDNYEQTILNLRSLKLKNPSEIFLQYQKSLINKKILIIHFRFGDYALEKDFGISSKMYFDNAISYHLAQINYDELIVFTNEVSKLSLYLDEKFKVRVISESSGLTASETLELMRYGTGYVISNSTFSWWGAFLSKTQNPIIICPNPWFKGLNEPCGLVPSHWVRMGSQ